MRGHGHGGNLGFVTHFGQKEGDQGRAEHAEFFGDLHFLVFDLVGNHGPDCHGDEGQAEHPAQDVRAQDCGNPGAKRAGQGMIEDGRHQNAGNDRQRFFEAGRQQKCQ